MPYGVLPNQQMSVDEQGRYVHCIAAHYKRKNNTPDQFFCRLPLQAPDNGKKLKVFAQP
jgi:hypothetical protein